MAKICNSVLDTIGNTPLIKINKLTSGLKASVYGKGEYFNPGSSVKDRIGIAMIEAAERAGVISPGDTIVEPTSGNTGIGIALAAAVKGYKVILVMPDTMTMERRKILKAFGAELVLTPGSEGMTGAVKKADLIKADGMAKFIPMQFKNETNPRIHYQTTGPEIFTALDGKVDVFVAAVGTGGTITGVGHYLKEKLGKSVHIVAVEPEESPVLSGGNPGPHKIQGAGAGFVPDVLDTTVYDEIRTVAYEDAITTARRLAREEGIFVGISAGANVSIAIDIAREIDHPANIVTILCDTGERYLSNPLWDI